jgi:signal transduction histidine kinase
MLYRISILLGFFLVSVKTYPQVSYNDLKSGLIIQFAKNIDWPEKSINRSFTIGFLGQDTTTFNIIQNQALQIKNKPVLLKWVKDLSQLSDINLLYVDITRVLDIESIAKEVENRHILLVSEQSNNSKYIMLNITYDADQGFISFDINRANIIIEGLGINPELLLFGASEVDIRELFREMKKSLDRQSEEVDAQKKVISKNQDQIGSLKTDIHIKETRNQELEESMNSLTSSIGEKQKHLDEVSTELAGQNSKLVNQSQQIENQKERLKLQEENLAKQEAQIAIRSSELEELTEESAGKQNIIKNQVDLLVSKEKLIGLQEVWIYIFITFLMVITGFGVAIYRAYKNKQILSEKLKLQHNSISELNNDLISTNDELNTSNNNLLNQKEHLAITLEQLKSTQFQLLQSEKMAALGLLTAGVAHEINNPINFIKSGASVLKNITKQTKGSKGEIQDINTFKKLVDSIEIGSNRIVGIVKSLNAFSRSEGDENRPCNLHEIIDNCLMILTHEHKHKIVVEKNYRSQGAVVISNESKIYQVFTNLLANAIQAITEEGKITITTKLAEAYIETIIEDNGYGISEENLAHIFDPFFTTKEPGKGTGLGLSIVYTIIQEQEGFIVYNSILGEGTKVSVKLLSD